MCRLALIRRFGDPFNDSRVTSRCVVRRFGGVDTKSGDEYVHYGDDEHEDDGDVIEDQNQTRRLFLASLLSAIVVEGQKGQNEAGRNLKAFKGSKNSSIERCG